MVLTPVTVFMIADTTGVNVVLVALHCCILQATSGFRQSTQHALLYC